MGRVFITGDKHGNFQDELDYHKIKKLCDTQETTKDDVIIILGDHGIHYDDSWSDHNCRKKLAKYPITFVMIRGNHDMRPNYGWKRHIIENSTMEGWFVDDPENDNIFYTEEFGWYTFAGKKAFVISGAYSVDKFYRLQMYAQGNRMARWFPNEQLDASERERAEQVLFDESRHINEPFYIFSHTCPWINKPIKVPPVFIDQSQIDETMEFWMDTILARIEKEEKPLKGWYCGHWHVDTTVNEVRFMYRDILEFSGGEGPWNEQS